MQKALIPICEKNAIERAYTMLALEMGHTAAAIAVYDQIVDHYGSNNASWFLRTNGRAFPILAAMADESGSHRIRKRIIDLNSELSTFFHNKTNIVCIGAESAWLDIAAPHYLDKTFYVVPHSGGADLDRFISNYGSNVRIHDSVDLTHLSGAASVIVNFAYGVTGYTYYTYPVAYRICGRDTRQTFSQLIAIELIDCPLKFYPNGFVAIDFGEMTHILARSSKSIRRISTWKPAAF